MPADKGVPVTYKQLNLFGESESRDTPARELLPASPPADMNMPDRLSESHLPGIFLPGVKGLEAFPKINSLDELKAMALNCSDCRLRSNCRQVVFGEGPANARLMLIGEGPGEEEDKSGRPFVGRAGQLLDRILEAAELKREEVYIANVVKCRPPSNRLPQPDEIKVCRNYLEAQIRLIHPSIIICLGSLASRTVLDPRASITRIRGQWYMRQGLRVIATFHPAALLRNESYKRPVWEDFKSIRDEFRKLENFEPE